MVEYNVKDTKWYRKYQNLPGWEIFFVRVKEHYLAKQKPVMARTVELLNYLKCPITRIEMETINRCQNTCSFCPVAVGHDIRKPTYMDDALFNKIMDDLHGMDYSGGLYLSSNNEPLLDAKIVDRLKIARAKVPNAVLFMYTNGLLLTPEKYHGIMESLDQLMLDNYSDDLKLIPSVKETLLDATQSESDRTIILMRLLHDVLDTRGGFSPSRSIQSLVDISCSNPFSEMVITPDGTVSMCCQDVYNQHIMGDLKTNTILEVWHGRPFEDLRRNLLAKCRSACPICSVCDFARSSPICTDDIVSNKARRVKSLEGYL